MKIKILKDIPETSMTPEHEQQIREKFENTFVCTCKTCGRIDDHEDNLKEVSDFWISLLKEEIEKAEEEIEKLFKKGNNGRLMYQMGFDDGEAAMREKLQEIHTELHNGRSANAYVILCKHLNNLTPPKE
jgi:predicted nuclease with TOPRIM domain